MSPEVKTGIEGDLYIYAGTINWATSSVTGTRLAFCEGVSYSWDEDHVPIWDRGTYSHYKQGRGKGELSANQSYVDNTVLISSLDSGTVAGSTAPRLQAEMRIYGTAGALDHTVQFSDVVKKNYGMDEPEGAETNKNKLAFDYYKEPVRSSASRIG